MAPPTVVLQREFVNIPQNCPIVELVQNQCNFNRASGTFHCKPFTRSYRACETPNGVRHYEITKTEPSPEVKKATKDMLTMSDQ